jgi:UDP-N-acetylglucosamine/UDP-N-acetyl-alpha-D-glucosaminouronate 4-epimerase
MATKFLVTGGAGFIGSHIVKRLVDDGAEVRVVDNFSTGQAERLDALRSSIEFVKGDLAEQATAREIVDGVDLVIHQAAVPSVQRSVADPVATNRANVTATVNLLEACRDAQVRRIVFAASSSAYGDTEVLPKREDMPANPLSPYALQKLIGEGYCKLYHDLFGLETVCLRYFNVFGPYQDPHSEYSAVIPKFITRLLANQPITIHGDGEQSRDFTFIDNVVEANLLALKAPDAAGKMCNIGCGEHITLNRLVMLLEQHLGVNAKVIHAPPKPGDVRHSLADIERAKAILHYRPKITVEEGLRRTIAWYKSQMTRHRSED